MNTSPRSLARLRHCVPHERRRNVYCVYDVCTLRNTMYARQVIIRKIFSIKELKMYQSMCDMNSTRSKFRSSVMDDESQKIFSLLLFICTSLQTARIHLIFFRYGMKKNMETKLELIQFSPSSMHWILDFFYSA